MDTGKARFADRKTTQLFLSALEIIREEHGEDVANQFSSAIRRRGDQILTSYDERDTYWLTEKDVREVVAQFVQNNKA